MSQDRIPRDVAGPAARLGAFLRRFPRRFCFSVGAAVLACAAMYGVESVVESWLESAPRGHSPLTRSVFELSRLYQAAVTVGWRKPQPRFTVIVELSVDRDAQLKSVSVNMVCAQREFLARLVKKITTVGPAVIVLDKYFSRGTCDEDRTDRARTDQLKGTLFAALAADVPVVVGLSARVTDGAIRPEPSLFDANPEVGRGIVNIDRDTRRMALRWCGTVDPKSGSTTPDSCEALALRVARAYDRQIMVKSPRLREALAGDRHPYISFMRPEQFCRLAVKRTLEFERVDPPGGSVDPSVCPSEPGADLTYLHGKIVLVGETSRDLDTHVSVVGSVSGLFMQANYIEALLDDRYFRPAPGLDYMFGITMFAIVTLVPLALHAHPRWALVFVGASLVAMMGLVVGLILLGGLYVNPVGVGVLALLFDGSHVGLSWLLRKAVGEA